MTVSQQAAAEQHAEDGASLISILDELTELVTTARAMPMSASVLVNRAEALDLIDAARAVVPEEIQTADDIVADADAMVERARHRADKIVEEARARAEELVSEENVVRLAEERAEQIVGDAEAKAAKLAADANDYCDRQLAQFEIDLNSISTQVRAGREALSARAGRGAFAAEE
jgi:cell division septum initiation protein DivIVA